MDQRTHSWIALRAIALLKDEGAEENLVSLLSPHARQASVGAWIPDMEDARRTGSIVGNHILKMEPYEGKQTDRFVVTKDVLLKQLGSHRLTTKFVAARDTLNPEWWKQPYKGSTKKPGQHLPNRAMAMGTMMKDILLVGNAEVDSLVPGDVRFMEDVAPEMQTTDAAAALYFFMLSHFIADSSMPCHCDGRALAGYEAGLHKELEEHWSKNVGTYFEKHKLLKNGETTDEVLNRAREIDGKFGLDFSQTTVPGLLTGHDIWLEMMYVCRASFAMACIIASPDKYNYDDKKARAPFEEVLGGNEDLLSGLDKAVLHDSVLNTAIVWKHIWEKMSTGD